MQTPCSVRYLQYKLDATEFCILHTRKPRKWRELFIDRNLQFHFAGLTNYGIPKYNYVGLEVEMPFLTLTGLKFH